MITFASAVLVASLLGSMHCVGMCGPFALWATRGGNRWSAVIAYHLGRLTTYLSAGLAAGAVGSAVTLGGNLAGFQSSAAKVAGGLLILFGLARLLQLVPIFQRRATAPRPSRIASLLSRAKPLIASRGPTAQGFLGGLLTTWLPCGWLYLFVLVAAGTGQVAAALLVMVSFWLGTLPALTVLILGTRRLIPRIGSALPFAAACLLILTGLYTATGRASADLSSLLVKENLGAGSNLESLADVTQQPLPCCVDVKSSASP